MPHVTAAARALRDRAIVACCCSEPAAAYNRPMTRAQGIIVGLGASWIKALTEPRLQSIAERILPPSPAQKLEVGADPAGRPENMPPAFLANRTAVALGHGELTDRQRLRVQDA